MRGLMKHIAAAACCAVAVFLHTAEARAELASHRAIYDIAITTTRSTSIMQSVHGRTITTIRRLCDGWQTTDDHLIFFGIEGGEEYFAAHGEAWESADGNGFTFSGIEKGSRTGTEQYSGFARLHGDGSTREAGYTGEDGGQTIARLPADTHHPVAYTRLLLEAARRGEKGHNAVLFVGGNAEDSHHRVSTVIGKRKPLAARIPGQVLPAALAGDGYWPLRLAYFDPDTDEAEPDYEIGFEMQDNGVILGYSIDYGDFSTRAALREIAVLGEPDCP